VIFLVGSNKNTEERQATHQSGAVVVKMFVDLTDFEEDFFTNFDQKCFVNF